MASVILNEGNLIEPTIIDRIIDEQGTAIYRSRVKALNQAIKPESSKAVNNLMKATIQSGTCRKLFNGYRKDRILSKLNIGGKTGSIDDTSHQTRFDWFIGFAQEKGGDEKIALSVVVAHEKYIGKRAGYYAKIMMKEYFRDYFAKKSGSNQHCAQLTENDPTNFHETGSRKTVAEKSLKIFQSIDIRVFSRFEDF